MIKTRLFITGSAVLLTLTACGKKGALVYPDMMNPAAPTVVSVRQSGAAIRLEFVLPEKDRAGRSLKGLAGIEIARKGMVSGDGFCKACTSDYTPLSTVYLDVLKAEIERNGNNMIMFDNDVAEGYTYSYSLLPFSDVERDGGQVFTNAVDVMKKVVPPSLVVESLPTEIKLTIKNSISGGYRMIGYNIYRWPVGGIKSSVPVNREPVLQHEYHDVQLKRGVQYNYAVSLLVEYSAGKILESEWSRFASGKLADDEN